MRSLFSFNFRFGLLFRLIGNVALASAITGAVAQQAAVQPSDGVTIRGSVRDSTGSPVAGASVLLDGDAGTVVKKTDAEGVFVFPGLRSGSYRLSAETSGSHSATTTVVASFERQQERVDLVVGGAEGGASSGTTSAMEFADKPNFTVAGVTDWTAVGGHGSDASLRTSEALTRESLTLKPESSATSPVGFSGSAGEASEGERKLRKALDLAPRSFEANHRLGEFYLASGRYRESMPLLQAAYEINPADRDNAYDLALSYKDAGELAEARERVKGLLKQEDGARLHRLLGELDEGLGDPLAAVHEYERAARLDPSEQNYFEWGSELLLHRAVWQAVEVFENGAKANPKSARMLAALGTALFASARYDDAALRLCEASDLEPAAPEPYLFMGKIEMAAPTPLACVEQKLARFLRERPDDSLANYFYAMSLWKRQEQSAGQRDFEQVETLLTKAAAIDPKYGDTYLQLGVLSFAQHNYEKAVGYYKKAIEVNPELGDAHYRLGVAYDRLGKPDSARHEFQLHDAIEKAQADAVERQRREVKQFLVVLQGQPERPLSR